LINLLFYVGSCRGGTVGELFDCELSFWLARFSPVSLNISLTAPMLDNMPDVSTGMKITFELLPRVISFKLSM
jgi:hypothetical protein